MRDCLAECLYVVAHTVHGNTPTSGAMTGELSIKKEGERYQEYFVKFCPRHWCHPIHECHLYARTCANMQRHSIPYIKCGDECRSNIHVVQCYTMELT